MIKVVSGRRGDRWSLVHRTGLGADVLAHSASGTHDARLGFWQPALARLSDGDGTLSVDATADGHFRWVFTGADGAVIAESPPVYRDQGGCRSAFDAARRAARAALGRQSPHTVDSIEDNHGSACA